MKISSVYTFDNATNRSNWELGVVQRIGLIYDIAAPMGNYSNVNVEKINSGIIVTVNALDAQLRLIVTGDQMTLITTYHDEPTKPVSKTRPLEFKRMIRVLATIDSKGR